MNNPFWLAGALGMTIPDNGYYLLAAILAGVVLYGIHLMSRVQTARLGNLLSAAAMAAGVILTLVKYNLLQAWMLYPCLAVGAALGLLLAYRVKMIEMPQMVALLNSLGGLASAIVGGYAWMGIGAAGDRFSTLAAVLALEVGVLTFCGSLVAAGKLHRLLPQAPLTLPRHQWWTGTACALCLLLALAPQFVGWPAAGLLAAAAAAAAVFGVVFTIKIGGADMPITISLLNSLSGVAGAISGLAIGDVLLVAVGGIVGASGLLLTQIMCRAMNRRLFDILLGSTRAAGKSKPAPESGPAPGSGLAPESGPAAPAAHPPPAAASDPLAVLQRARNVIIVPGYGMALAQAQHLVKELADRLRAGGAQVRYAIHPVAGRMPGHMNVLLAEANVDYDDLFEMDDLNPEFAGADLAIAVGANDVMNPAARAAEGTPIYGMPVLNVDACKEIFIFNYDLRPGYAGVENPLYQRPQGVHLFLGNAAETLKKLLDEYKPAGN